MARAAAQMMGIFAAVEGFKFGRRVPALLQAILPALQRATQEVCLVAYLLINVISLKCMQISKRLCG